MATLTRMTRKSQRFSSTMKKVHETALKVWTPPQEATTSNVKQKESSITGTIAQGTLTQTQKVQVPSTPTPMKQERKFQHRDPLPRKYDGHIPW